MSEQDEALRRYVAQSMENISRCGRTLVGVFALAGSKDPANETFVYTIGNSLAGLPELLIVGLCEDRGILNAMSKIMIERGRGFDDGEMVKLGALPVCCVHAAPEVQVLYTIQVARFVPDPYSVIQVVLCDPKGRFPWDRGCAKPFRDVKVRRRLDS
jgi:hypothetical protein